MIKSIKLESFQIPKFYSLLEEFGITSLPPRSDFEAYFGELDGSHISIQINGQISHDNDRRLQELIDLVYAEIEQDDTGVLNADDYQSTYMILARPSTPPISSYQINHLNIWLHDEQYKLAIDLLSDDEKVKEDTVEQKFELHRFIKNDQTISFHENGKVIAENGYSVFAPYLSEAIETYLPYKDYDLIIGQDEVGNGERIGPLVVSAVAGTPKQISDLQLLGVKDSKMVPRGITFPMAKWIKDTAVCTNIKKMDPQQFNQIRLENQTSLSEILTDLHKNCIQQMIVKLRQFGNEFENVIYIIDQYDKYLQFKNLKDEVSFDLDFEYVPHGEFASISVAAASIISKSSRLRWIKLHEKVHQIKLSRSNLSIIKQHRKASSLLKSL